MDNRAQNWIGNTGLNAGFAHICRYQSLLRTESCRFGHTPVQDRSYDMKGKPQNGSVWHQRCNSTQVSQFPFLQGSPSKLLSTTQEQTLPLWAYTGWRPIRRYKRSAPEQSMCGTRGTTQNQRNPHSIKGCAYIPYIKNRVARAFPIQFTVLYYP